MKNVIKRLIGNIECIGPKLSFSLRDFIPYVLAIFLVISIHSIRIEGDTLALITGLRKAMSCFHILNAEVPCGAGVLHFPIFQYLIGLLPALFSRKDEVVATTFIFVNLAGVFFAAYAFARGGALGAGKKGSHFAMILLLSSYFIWYPWSTFNEATAFTLFSMLAIAVLDKWSLAWISIISFLCVITKEISPPFVMYFLVFGSFLTQKLDGLSIKSLRSIVNDVGLPFLGVLLGVSLNLAFNYFRFGDIRNLSNLDPKLLTASNYIFEYFYYLFFSPSSGLIIFWLSFPIFILGALAFAREKLKIIAIFLCILPIFIINWGLAHWYSPFGWNALGPRLSLPYLGAVGVFFVYIASPILDKVLNRFNWIFVFVFLTVVGIISALPALTAYLDSALLFRALFEPDENTAALIRNGLISREDLYIVGMKKSVIIPIIVDAIKNSRLVLYYFCWLLVFVLISFLIAYPEPLNEERINKDR